MAETENNYNPFASETETQIDPDFFRNTPRKGIFGNLSPEAAKLLPDPTHIGMHEVSEYHGTHFNIFDTPVAQVPFAAIARNQYDQQAGMSANTKLMNNYITNILKTPKTADPRVANAISQYTSDAVADMIKLQRMYPRDWERMYLSNKGMDSYSANLVSDMHDRLGGISALADTGNYLEKKRQEMDAARKGGNLVSATTRQGLDEMTHTYYNLPEHSSELSYKLNAAAEKIYADEPLIKILNDELTLKGIKTSNTVYKKITNQDDPKATIDVLETTTNDPNSPQLQTQVQDVVNSIMPRMSGLINPNTGKPFKEKEVYTDVMNHIATNIKEVKANPVKTTTIKSGKKPQEGILPVSGDMATKEFNNLKGDKDGKGSITPVKPLDVDIPAANDKLGNSKPEVITSLLDNGVLNNGSTYSKVPDEIKNSIKDRLVNAKPIDPTTKDTQAKPITVKPTLELSSIDRVYGDLNNVYNGSQPQKIYSGDGNGVPVKDLKINYEPYIRFNFTVKYLDKDGKEQSHNISYFIPANDKSKLEQAQSMYLGEKQADVAGGFEITETQSGE